MIVIDGHLDLAMNALDWNRDLRLTAHETRDLERGMEQKGRAAGTVSFPDMRRGSVAVTFCTVIARVKYPGATRPGARTHEIAYGRAQGMLAYYRELQRQNVVRMIADTPTLDHHLQNWQASPDTTPIGCVLTMEGADPIVEPSQVHDWWAQGLRAVSLTHYGPSAYAHGTQSVGGLTPKGRELLREMEQIGMILDVTHLSDDSFWEAVNAFHGPVIASHSNCRALVPGDRQLTDDMIRQMIERGGVIGTAMDAWMLEPGWVIGTTMPERVTIQTAVEHIDHVCQLAGNARHAAIGTDLDGGYGTEQCPNDLDTIADLQRIPDLLSKRGYAPEDIQAVMYRNWRDALSSAWAGN